MPQRLLRICIQVQRKGGDKDRDVRYPGSRKFDCKIFIVTFSVHRETGQMI